MFIINFVYYLYYKKFTLKKIKLAILFRNFLNFNEIITRLSRYDDNGELLFHSSTTNIF